MTVATSASAAITTVPTLATELPAVQRGPFSVVPGADGSPVARTVAGEILAGLCCLSRGGGLSVHGVV